MLELVLRVDGRRLGRARSYDPAISRKSALGVKSGSDFLDTTMLVCKDAEALDFLWAVVGCIVDQRGPSLVGSGVDVVWRVTDVGEATSLPAAILPRAWQDN